MAVQLSSPFVNEINQEIARPFEGTKRLCFDSWTVIYQK